MDGDGRLDVVVSHVGWLRVGVYYQGADGRLSAEDRYEASYGRSGWQTLAVGDVDGDGRRDILFDGQLIRQLGGGAGAMAAAAPAVRPVGAARSAAVALRKAAARAVSAPPPARTLGAR
jgi:hypothetical protein